MENNNTRRPAHVGRTIVIAVLAVVILVLLLSSLYVVQPDEYGVVRQFGAVVDVKSEPGLYFKIPFVQEMSTLPNTVLLYDLPVSDMISADKTTLIADCFAIWRIEDPRLFIETLSGSVSNAEGRINANVYNALKTVLSSMTQAEIISGRDGTLVRTVMATIGATTLPRAILPRARAAPRRSATRPTNRCRSSSPTLTRPPPRCAPRATRSICAFSPRCTTRRRKPSSIRL